MQWTGSGYPLAARLQQIERMPASEKRHILHMPDTFIEHARYKQQAA